MSIHLIQRICNFFGFSMSFVLGVFYFTKYGYLGFPDGYLTPYEDFLKYTLYPTFLLLNLLFFCYFFFSMFRRKNNLIIWTFLTYIVLISFFVGIDYNAIFSLDNGRGA